MACTILRLPGGHAALTLEGCTIKPKSPVSTDVLLKIKALAGEAVSSLNGCKFSSQLTFTISDSDGVRVSEYALSGSVRFVIEPGSIDCIAHPQIEASDADIHVLEGRLKEAQIRQLLVAPTPEYTFSTVVQSGGLVSCPEEFQFSLAPVGDVYCFTCCELNGNYSSLDEFELTLPELSQTFEALAVRVKTALEG